MYGIHDFCESFKLLENQESQPRVCQLIIFRPYLNMEGKALSQYMHFFLLHYFAKFHDSEIEIFQSPNYSKFADDAPGIVGFLKYVQKFGFY